MRADLLPPARRRRAVAPVVALTIAFGLIVTGCGGNDEPGTPAISGGNPGDVTVPTTPPTTAEAQTTTTEGSAPAETTIPLEDGDEVEESEG